MHRGLNEIDAPVTEVQNLEVMADSVSLDLLSADAE